jgi:alcohol dehydrogenase
MLPYVMTYNLPAAATEIAQVGGALGLTKAGKTPEGIATATIAEITRLFAAIGIPATLADLGLPADKVDWTAEQALGIDRLIKNNPRPFDLVAMQRLVRAAHTGNLAASAI